MAHVRTQIRDRLVLILTGLATTGANVFAGRVYPLADAEVPALLIDTLDEEDSSPEIAGGASRIIARSLTVLVRGCVKQEDDYQDALDQMALEVEQALAADNTLGSLVKYVNPLRMTVKIAGEGEKPVATMEMEFEVSYYTALNAPDTPS